MTLIRGSLGSPRTAERLRQDLHGGPAASAPPERSNEGNTMARKLDVFEKHQLRIARRTLTMAPAMVAVFGGPTIEEAREIIARLTGRKA